ncbi:MAG: transposase, partial [Gammaproteobacteria bacterium]|nr:transposase [Gammaproteobacteria bacterium]
MFRKNEQHLQMSLFSSINALPEKLQKRLEESWSGIFYREFFVRIDETPFAILYSDEASRPNIP